MKRRLLVLTREVRLTVDVLEVLLEIRALGELAATMALRAGVGLLASVLVAEMVLEVVAAFEGLAVARTVDPLTDVTALLVAAVDDLLVLDVFRQMCPEVGH